MPSSSGFQKLVTDAKSSIREISVHEAEEQRRQEVLLIDVREKEDFQKEHASGATHISRGVLEMTIEEKASDLSTPVICYCGGGSRSALAIESLQKMGYTKAVSMAGGFKAWKEANLPTAQTDR